MQIPAGFLIGDCTLKCNLVFSCRKTEGSDSVSYFCGALQWGVTIESSNDKTERAKVIEMLALELSSSQQDQNLKTRLSSVLKPPLSQHPNHSKENP